MPDLPRQQIARFGWKPDKPDFRDTEHLYRVTAPVSLPVRAGVPKLFQPPRRDQGNQGACTGFSSAFACDCILARENQPHHSSPAFAYWGGRDIEGSTDQDAGAEIRDVIKALALQGICPEQVWPYNEGRFNLRPTKDAYSAALQDLITGYSRVEATSMYLIKQALAKGNPIVFGFSVYESFMDMPATGSMPKPSGKMLGGHAVCMVAYDDTVSVRGNIGAVKIANSWGPGWGSNGYFWMPYAYITNRNLCSDFWTINAIT